MNQLKKEIENLQKRICREIPDINSGGCIHFAYFFSKKLRELKIEHSIIFGNYDEVNTRFSKFCSVTHVMVYIKGIGYIDGLYTTESIDNDYNYIKEESDISLFKLNILRKPRYNWNTYYNTDNNLQLVQLINKYIKNGK